jgi:hypothetical protein
MSDYISQILFLKKPNKRFIKKLIAYFDTNDIQQFKRFLNYKVDNVFCPYLSNEDIEHKQRIISAYYNLSINIELLYFKYEIYDFLLEYIFKLQNMPIQHSNHIFQLNEHFLLIEYQLKYNNNILTPNNIKELIIEINGEEDCYYINYTDLLKDNCKKLFKNNEYKNLFCKQLIYIYIIQWILGFHSNDIYIVNNNSNCQYPQILPLNETIDNDINSQPFDFKKLFSNKNNFFNKQIYECVIGYFNYTPNLLIYKNFLQNIYQIFENKSIENTKYNDIKLLYRINKMYRYFD